MGASPIIHRHQRGCVSAFILTLVKGGTIEDAANILGDSPAVIRRYYAKRSVAYQSRTVEIMQRDHGTSAAHTENTFRNALFSTIGVVPEVGLEPTRPVKCAGF
jgi:hypothetical protein